MPNTAKKLPKFTSTFVYVYSAETEISIFWKVLFSIFWCYFVKNFALVIHFVLLFAHKVCMQLVLFDPFWKEIIFYQRLNYFSFRLKEHMAFHERLSESLKLFKKKQCSMKVARMGSLNVFLKEVCQSVRSPLQAFYLKKKEYVYINSIYTKMDLIKNERDALWQDDWVLGRSIFLSLIFLSCDPFEKFYMWCRENQREHDR